MIVAAGLLVLLGLGLFVGGILTGTTAFYWGCVAACVVAAVLLFLARRTLTEDSRTTAAGRGTERAATTTSTPARGSVPGAVAGAGVAAASAPEPAAAPSSGATAASTATPSGAAGPDDPPVEEVEVTDLLMVVDLTDEVLVVDEHPRYHLPGCRHLVGREVIPIPLDEARTDGFTPCAVCTPDRNLALRARERRRAAGS